MVIFHSPPTFEYTLHTRPFQWLSSPSSPLQRVSISTTASAPSPCSETSIFLVRLLLWTSSCVSKSSRHLLPHLSESYLPRTRRHSIGSWDVGLFGQGQTMSGWNTLSSRPTSCVSQPLVSLSTISRISDSASFIFSSFTRGMHACPHCQHPRLFTGVRGRGILRPSGVLIRGSWSIVTFGACEGEKPHGNIREPTRTRHILWEGRDDHQKSPGTCGPRRRGRCALLWPIRAAALGRRGRVDPVRRSPPHAPTGHMLFRPPLARSTGRVSLRHLGRGDCDRGGRSPPAPTRRRGVLAGGRRERPPCREPLGVALLLPHRRH